MNTPLLKNWNPKPAELPQVDPTLKQMDSLQRSTESLRYVLLRWEHWASPSGDIREWLRHNTRVGAWLLIPAIFVMPLVGFILWQVTGWLSMLTSSVGHLILLLLVYGVFKTVVAIIKR